VSCRPRGHCSSHEISRRRRLTSSLNRRPHSADCLPIFSPTSLTSPKLSKVFLSLLPPGPIDLLGILLSISQYPGPQWERFWLFFQGFVNILLAPPMPINRMVTSSQNETILMRDHGCPFVSFRIRPAPDGLLVSWNSGSLDNGENSWRSKSTGVVVHSVLVLWDHPLHRGDHEEKAFHVCPVEPRPESLEGACEKSLSRSKRGIFLSLNVARFLPPVEMTERSRKDKKRNRNNNGLLPTE